jgi:DNA-binding SARP family transcriptional activator
MEFRILGPLEVLDEGRTVALGGSKQRALLAVLLLHANETLTSDRLIEELWGDRPPATAAKALQVHVSRLRRGLAGAGNGTDGVLVTREHGYELALPPDHLDAHRFERLVAEGRNELAAGHADRAAAALEQALGLWRGAPLADLAYEPFAQHEIPRLQELRLGAVQQLIDAKLALGRHAEVVGELEALIRAHPYREHLRAQLMLALYRSERQADALQAYQDARKALVEQLGIEPAESLRTLERAILAQDRSLHLTVAEPATAEQTGPEPPRGAFVGRDAELARLVAGLDDAFGGRGGVFLLAGEPGIGKSRLAEELAVRARARGARVLVGRSWEAGGAPAFWPWVQSLRGYVRESDAADLRAHLGDGAADLAQILPELRGRFSDLPEPRAPESEGARFRLFEAVGSLLQLATRDRPVVVVLDDLHAADEPSLLLLRFIARQIAASPLLVLCAYRDVDPTVRDPLSWTVAELAREPQTRHVELAGLGERDVADYIELSTGVEPAPRLVRAIRAETEGNPLFLAEVVRLLDAEGRIAEPDAHLGIPPGVRAVIGRRVGRLSEPCRRLLVSASVLGREFGLDALARLSAVDLDELLEVLDEAMAERVIGEAPGSSRRLRFGHALIRDTLYDELTAARRLQLHQRAGEALEAIYAADLDPHLAELAHHFAAAAPAAPARKAVDYARRAGDRAASQLAYEEAGRLYETGLTLVDDDVTRCELLLALGDAQARAGDTRSARQWFGQAADLADRRGLTEQCVRAALGYGGRAIWEVTRDDAGHLALLERALAAIGDSDSMTRVKLLARLAGGPLRDASFAPERRRSLGREALEMARRIGDKATLPYALAGYITAHHSPAFTPEQAVLGAELVEAALEAGDLERAVEGHEHRGTALLELGDLEGAKGDFAAMASLAAELRQPSHDWFALVYGGVVALLEGRLAEAEDLITRAHSVGERVHSWSAAVTYGLQLYVLRHQQGRLDDVEGLVRRSVAAYPTYPIWRCVEVHLAVEAGRTSEARTALEAVAVDDFASLPFDEEWLVSMGLLAEAASALGDADCASVLHRQLLPYADRVAVSYPEVATGAVARSLGLAAATTGCWEDAERHFAAAIELNERIGARPWLAHTRRDYARALDARGRPGDRASARELLAAARSTYRDLGMTRWAERL